LVCNATAEATRHGRVLLEECLRPRIVAADGQVPRVEQCRADQEAERDLQVEEAADDLVLSKGLGPDFADP
jgi:hypothetical protein